MLIILFLIIFSLFTVQLSAQQLPDIFADTPKELIETKIITEFPVNTFLENIAITKKGEMFVTSLEDGVIYRIKDDGKKSVFAKIDGKVAGIAFDATENLLVTGWAKSTNPTVFEIDKSGKIQSETLIKDAIFLNGIIHFKGSRFLIADSYKGVIWEFDAKTNNYSVWLSDEKLARTNPQNPFPAINGLRIFKNTLYATNTEQQLLLKIPIDKNGEPAKPEIFIEKINGDDFAIDKKGNIYITTHVYNNIVKVSPTGKMTIVVEGETVIGGTSLALGRGKFKQNIYIVTNGGMSLPPVKGVQSAKIIRIKSNK